MCGSHLQAPVFLFPSYIAKSAPYLSVSPYGHLLGGNGGPSRQGAGGDGTGGTKVGRERGDVCFDVGRHGLAIGGKAVNAHASTLTHRYVRR